MKAPDHPPGWFARPAVAVGAVPAGRGWPFPGCGDGGRGKPGASGGHSKLLLLGLALATCREATVAQVPGEAFTVIRSAVAGGGGVSTGGDFTVASTTAQPEAGLPLVGGGFAVQGGFRGQLATAAIEDGPTLQIVLVESGALTISWSPATPGFVLQETTDLAEARWIPTASGATNPVTLPASGSARFYRLVRP